MAKCGVCHRGCDLAEGQMGLCMARKCENGVVLAANYGAITSIALDPIEKKPLNLFYPGSKIISVGSYGCNLRCPFCQNHEISYGFLFDSAGSGGIDPDNSFFGGTRDQFPECRFLDPKDLAELAVEYVHGGNIGVAFTYNEPLVGYEYVIDAAKEVHRRGLKTVLVSNGCVTQEICEKVSEHIDAMNIDLKGFTDEYYEKVLGGSRQMVMDFITTAAKTSHMEVTTLIVPGYNDTEDEMKRISSWIAQLNEGNGAKTIALHISRYFPRFKMTDIPATDVDLIYKLADVARQELKHVFVGNC